MIQELTPEQLEWISDIENLSDELMSQPLTVTHPLAFYAPEVIREKALMMASGADEIQPRWPSIHPPPPLPLKTEN